jgi:CTP synthase
MSDKDQKAKTVRKTKYIFITGGVSSSLGKGIASSALGALLQTRGYSVRLRKFDPYLNVDPGTMSPYQHGEVFVTDDGAETDLDLGHYERFTDVCARKTDNVTTGKIYSTVIKKERRGDYLGKTVQVIPHVTDMIKDCITLGDGEVDFSLCEIGGTVGDIEGLPYLEAIRQLANEIGRDRALFVHLTLVPYIPSAGELKTKPTQHAVKEMLSLGIQPDIILLRADRDIDQDIKDKVALFCNIPKKNVICALDTDTIYAVPSRYHAEGFDDQVLKHFGYSVEERPNLARWHDIVSKIRNPKNAVNIAVVGKYTAYLDSYKSLVEALIHGGIANDTKVNIDWIEADRLEENDSVHLLDHADGILVPGAFGERGADGMEAAIKYARENKVPFFGICFGMQLAVIEYAKNVAGISGAGSTEFGPCADPVVGLLTEWTQDEKIHRRREEDDLGGTMRLGAYPCALKNDSLAKQIYEKNEISERHRHRYEVNISYKDQLEKAGLIFSGMSPDKQLPEMIELKDHPWFIGGQFHPELKSRPFSPHPLFTGFVKAACQYSLKDEAADQAKEQECQTAS